MIRTDRERLMNRAKNAIKAEENARLELASIAKDMDAGLSVSDYEKVMKAAANARPWRILLSGAGEGRDILAVLHGLRRNFTEQLIMSGPAASSSLVAVAASQFEQDGLRKFLADTEDLAEDAAEAAGIAAAAGPVEDID